jgi:hypothetical protein
MGLAGCDGMFGASVGMGPAQALASRSSERCQSPTDPADGGDGGEQAPVARVGQPECVPRDLVGPVTGEHAQGDGLVAPRPAD